MTFRDVLAKIRSDAFTEQEKGALFEKLTCLWLMNDPRYDFEKVYLWRNFPYRLDFGDGHDIGIDLVAKDKSGEYWAIQCKCYAEHTRIIKKDVDTFIETSENSFNNGKRFSFRLFVSTTANWSDKAENGIRDKNPPVIRISIADLEDSAVDWDKLWKKVSGQEVIENLRKAKKELLPHQKEAIQEASKYYKDKDRGKLIMACGTGKTFTSLKVVEKILDGKGLVLFMVPSIALLNQTLNAWAIDAENPIKAVCVCSDIRAAQAREDFNNESIVDLALPASTNIETIRRQLLSYREYSNKGLVVVFSTYQSIQVVSDAQEEILAESGNTYGKFDFIVCDEAHRTTGVIIAGQDEGEFTRIHNNENVKGKKRLYMTATPRIYGDSARKKARESDCVLCSMDDEKLYGKEFYRIGFSRAVQEGLLTDYKVLVLTTTEEDIPQDILADVSNNDNNEFNYDDTTKLIGVINGLSKRIWGDEGKTWDADPRMMKRAVAFCHKIGSDEEPGTSKNTAFVFPKISVKYDGALCDEDKKHVIHIQTKHIDGSMNAQERNEILFWLKDEPEDKQDCRIVTNVRCLSEGVDVPALDAVIFLSSRNSQIDVVQSVGRVMRNFRKGQEGEKKYGYIIIPIVVPRGVKPEDALDNNDRFKVIWEILNALRSHDERLTAEVNRINLNKDKSSGQVLIGAPGFAIGQNALNDPQDKQDARALQNEELAKQLELRYGNFQSELYARLVKHCGNRAYLENWAADVGLIAQKFIDRIKRLVVKEGKYKDEFGSFLEGLQKNLNPSVDAEQAIEMLSQHLITRPVFDALFKDYKFVENNAVSQAMQKMIDLLREKAFDKDTTILDDFYKNVEVAVGRIDNWEGKQIIIKNLYESFFSKAFAKTVAKMGIVYTPVECVDFIIRSVEYILKKEFGSSLSDENVHILDPFTGTGTFITHLLQSGIIKPKDMIRKYKEEIHCNEIVLLAYYIADVNIESVFHDWKKRHEYEIERSEKDKYLPYDGICLTDTFQLGESKKDLVSDAFPDNTEQINKQKKTPIMVIMANPPYSIGQRSANDNAQNLNYPELDGRIEETYAEEGNASLQKGLYDSYIRAFRWASDRISKDTGGVIGFISNGTWLDGMSHDGFRKCLEKEFSSIYVFDLRGNQRTQGEESRREGGKIFGSGSRTPISITVMVKKPKSDTQEKAKIFYHDIGDYLSREAKLKIIKDFGSISSEEMEWTKIHPNKKNDWINQRKDSFDTLLLLEPVNGSSKESESFFVTYSLGVATNRDSWAYNSSSNAVGDNMKRMIDFYNAQCKSYHESDKSKEVKDFVDGNPQKISWTRGLRNKLKNGNFYQYNKEKKRTSIYRPYYKRYLYFAEEFIESPSQQAKLFPTPKQEEKNLVIYVSGKGGNREFSTLISNHIPDLQLLSNGQCFPLYWYEENVEELFSTNHKEKYVKKDGISNWILKKAQECYGEDVTKEGIFYYVYGFLHSTHYREYYKNDLKKSQLRIPLVEKAEDFRAFSDAGRALAELHLNYETGAPCPGVTVEGNRVIDDEYRFYSVTKMKFPKNGQKDTIIYNDNIMIRNIPPEAYEYVVNGRSAIEWVMENYQDYTDKDSQIRNDPNDWSREHEKPRYILDLLLSVINLSVKTMEIVKTLPKLTFEEPKPAEE